MMQQLKYYLILFLIISFTNSKGQDNIYEDLLRQEVEVENPVYMPVIGLGTGFMNYYGDIKNQPSTGLGNQAYKINISTFIDKNHYVKGNFFIYILGKLSGEQYSATNPINNYNFKTDITTFGVSFQYRFEPYISKEKKIHPFVAGGFEMVQFSTKTDILGANDAAYNYWKDGSIRDDAGNLLARDYNFETDVRKKLNWGYEYSQSAVGFPLDLGVELKITDRAFMQVGYSIHFLFTDAIDHVSSKNTAGIIGEKGNDRYTFTYATLFYDLFSDAETMTIQKLFADFEFDHTMYDDEDNDWVLDRVDKCPTTPSGVDVDSVGCPFDDDSDGVPNYLDLEKSTPPNSFVNQQGKKITIDEIIALMSAPGVSRADVKAILKSNMSREYRAALSGANIPQKFKHLDFDGDGYISFDEMLDAIENFFDNKDDLQPDDIKKLKDFFFEQ